MIRSSLIRSSVGSPKRVLSGFGLVVTGTLLVTLSPSLPLIAGASTPAVHATGAYRFNAPTSAAVYHGDLYVTNGAGNTVTEVAASTGAHVATFGGTTYGFDGPTAILLVGSTLFVADGAGNALTEFDAGTRAFVRQITGTQFSDPIALAAGGGDVFALNAAGSVTEVSASTGEVLGNASGSQFGFSTPTSIAIADHNLFVTNSASNSVTEINADTMAFVATISGSSYGFDEPAGILNRYGTIWVANQAGGSVTEFSAATGDVVRVITNSWLPTPVPITFGDGYVFTASPPGSSPMVSQITPSSGSVNWMMCNTNGPYHFNNPQSLVVAGSNLWVVNEGGNSLTEINADSGALVRVVS
jgi:hypothetical protein